jgi:ATP-binding cassette subfamily F protein uup
LVAKNLDFTWDGKYYLKNFSYTFSRFEKIGIIGSNGSGKSTFLDIIMQYLKPIKGSIELGETIRFGYYRQEGMNFDENMKVLNAVTDIAETIKVSKGDRITASQFLTYFRFPPQRQHDYIYKLSGGEKRRLYLCQVLMRNPNFLVLDEPTNDIDITSLQVLEEYLSTFSGCVLVVSHDRYFMDSIIDHLFVFSEGGVIKDFPGNYSEYFSWKKKQEEDTEKIAEQKPKAKPKRTADKLKLSYKEKQELEQLEKEIENLEIEKSQLEKALNSGQLSTRELNEKSEQIGQVIETLEKKSDRWLELSEKL